MIKTWAKLGTIPTFIELYGNAKPEVGQRRKYREPGQRQWRYSTIEAVLGDIPVLSR